jgi:hypothetical protein
MSLHTTSLDPSNLELAYLRKTSLHDSLKYQDIEVETENNCQEENLFHNDAEKHLETESEEPEEDFSHLSLEEQAVLTQISRIIRQPLSN